MTSDSSKYSADYHLEDYQKKLRENQTSISSNIEISSDGNSSNVDFGSDSFPDLSDSMSHVETRLISQFREYKEIKKKLDDSKRELYLSTQMQVSVDNFKELERAYIHRKNTLDDKFLESDFRLDREFWIGTGDGKMKSLYQPEDYEPYTYFYLFKLTLWMIFSKLLPCEGEVARSAETEGFRGHLSQSGKIAEARQRTLPSRFAIHLPLVREGADLCELHAQQTYV